VNRDREAEEAGLGPGSHLGPWGLDKPHGVNGLAASPRDSTATPNHHKDGKCAGDSDSTAGSAVVSGENMVGRKRGEVGQVPQE
jgi:hypothetical protein